MINDIFSQLYGDKVLGCWIGKNCGGTLGGPLEIAWGLPEPFNVSWYPRIEPGGIPNDDLELQLIWLKALEEIGPGIRAADFARYWLNHVGYNPDEYGMHKTNLRLGLTPPVSGFYNNAFRDCMGSPIRSELWACIAPGHPRLAVQYAFEDALCDHAGGEGVYGSLFNTAVESAAFVLNDPRELIEIGLSYIPTDSFTARAVRAALDANAEGLDWRAARRRVLAVAPSANAQYAPPNIGFQIIGWLYGDDFGDALCKAVNCGYDTDCTGATLGSYLGIIGGAGALPERWTAPLGWQIPLSAPPGIRHAAEKGALPGDLRELTERVRTQAARVLAWHGIDAVWGVRRETLFADESVRLLWNRNPLRIDWSLAELEVGLCYVGSPVVRPGGKATVSVTLQNPQPEPLTVSRQWLTTTGWRVEKEGNLLPEPVEIAPGGTVAETWNIFSPASPRMMNESNRLDLRLHCAGRPAMPSLPLVLVAPVRARYSTVFDLVRGDVRASFDAVMPPEQPSTKELSETARPGSWTNFYAEGNAFGPDLTEALSGPGVLYVQTFVWLPELAEIRVGASAPCPTKLWVNGHLVAESFVALPTRPSYAGLSHPDYGAHAYGNCEFIAGWNEMVLKFVRGAEQTVAFDPHLTLCFAKRMCDGLTGAVRHRFPWETNAITPACGPH